MEHRVYSLLSADDGNKIGGGMRIYFGIGGQYGDIIMGEPSLRKLIKLHPSAEFVFGCSSRYGDVMPLFYDYHHQIIEYKIWDSYPLRQGRFSPSDQEYIASMRFDKMYSDAPKHTSQTWALRHHQVAEHGLMLGIEVDSCDIKLEKHFNVERRQKTVAISLFPASCKAEPRTVGTVRVKQIVNFIRGLGYEVLHLNGPNEPDVDGAVKMNLKYSDSAIAMLGTDLLVTADTGMSWVASAYNHPVVGLYGFGYWKYCNTATWKPINPEALYVESRYAKNIPLQDVFNAITTKLEG
jgi:hypothetical protein